jgi:hypothetical protein
MQRFSTFLRSCTWSIAKLRTCDLVGKKRCLQAAYKFDSSPRLRQCSALSLGLCLTQVRAMRSYKCAYTSLPSLTAPRLSEFQYEDTLAAFARIMCPGAVLRLASDVEDYGAWMMWCGSRSAAFKSIRQSEEEQRIPWDNFPGTRYEARAKRQGRTPRYMEFVRV